MISCHKGRFDFVSSSAQDRSESRGVMAVTIWETSTSNGSRSPESDGPSKARVKLRGAGGTCLG